MVLFSLTTDTQLIVVCYLWTDDQTVGCDVSRSFNWPLFSLVDDDEALIKVSVDMIDLSHSITDESDDTAFCQATIEFNSLDVIGQLLCYCSISCICTFSSSG